MKGIRVVSLPRRDLPHRPFGKLRVNLREPQGPCGMTVEKERSHDWGSPTIIVGMTNKKARSPPKRPLGLH